MGNKWGATSIEKINPGGSYQHIIRLGASFEWVPSLGRELEVQVGRSKPGSVPAWEAVSSQYRVELLPELPRVIDRDYPPPQYGAQTQIEQAIDALIRSTDFLAELEESVGDPDVDLVALTHGHMWGDGPLRRLAEELSDRGYDFERTTRDGIDVPKVSVVGGRKRIQTYAMHLSGPSA